MKSVWLAAHTVISPLGNSTNENYRNIQSGKTGIHHLVEKNIFVSKMDFAYGENETRFDHLCQQALAQLFRNFYVPPQTLLILSTTKGNIEKLGVLQPAALALHASAEKLAKLFGFHHHVVVSNACISGVLALITAKRMIQAGLYQHIVVLGAEVLSEFIVSGFQSLKALSDAPCRPFDKLRTGISLGEAAGAALITSDPTQLGLHAQIRLEGFGLTNDANHISGPSRTGEELACAVNSAMKNSGLTSSDLDFISAHGTATLFNDEMEAKAFTKSKVNQVAMNSLKGYFGHTLGAAGLIEVIISAESMIQQETIPSAGFNESGVSEPINVCGLRQKKNIANLLKTASGFGGCNAALILQRTN